MTESINHNFVRIRIVSHDSASIGKLLTFHNMVILITSAINKYHFHHNCKVQISHQYKYFFQKGFYEDKSKTQYF